jgi:hypothetical protein
MAGIVECPYSLSTAARQANMCVLPCHVQADGEAAGQPQAGTKEPQAAAGADCCIEDSQATIKYPTLLSQL